MPKTFRIEKTLVRRVCRRSVVLAGGRRIRTRLVIDDFSCWILVR
jgi:hypothetical protein